jgi:hypothetical protein
LKEQLQSGTSDKMNWLKNHTMTEEQRKKMIEDKLNRAVKFVALAAKKK